MKYSITRIEKPGLMNHWLGLELPDDAIPFHTEIWKNTYSERTEMVHDIGDIFDDGDCKYNKETGEVIKIRKDGKGLEEFKIVTKIYCLVRIPEEYKDNSETCKKIAKLIEEIKKRKYENSKDSKDALKIACLD